MEIKHWSGQETLDRVGGAPTDRIARELMGTAKVYATLAAAAATYWLANSTERIADRPPGR